MKPDMPFTHIIPSLFSSGQGNDLAVLSQSLFIVESASLSETFE
jgi:hypothetical protein